jgi:nitrogen fixation NifU-like protein
MTTELQELYQEIIIDHAKNPKNFKIIIGANHTAEGYNPLCGDRIQIYLKINSLDVIEDISFQGTGCAISLASASLMTEVLKNKSLCEAEIALTKFHNFLVNNSDKLEPTFLNKLNAFKGVRDYPSRIKCATLAWHTLNRALTSNADEQHIIVTTE